MKARYPGATEVILALGLLAVSVACASARNESPPSGSGTTGSVATSHAIGTFEVKLVPRAPDDDGSADIGRMSLAKQYHGDLEATSQGEMLAISTDVQGSAGYVAIERVEGTLRGQSGSFSLQHSGTLSRGAPQLSITVVPDSGTDALAGITGSMTIQISEGRHSYAFEYALRPPAAK